MSFHTDLLTADCRI